LVILNVEVEQYLIMYKLLFRISRNRKNSYLWRQITVTQKWNKYYKNKKYQ